MPPLKELTVVALYVCVCVCVYRRIEIDLRLGAAFTRFQTGTLAKGFDDLQSKVCVCVPMCPCVRVSVYLSFFVSLSLCVSLCLSVAVSISVSVSASLPLCLSACRICICVGICIYVCISDSMRVRHACPSILALPSLTNQVTFP